MAWSHITVPGIGRKKAERIALEGGIGLGIAALAALILGLVGLFRAPLLWGVLIIAALSLFSFTGFMVEPPLVGFAAEWGGSLRIGIAVLIPAAIVSILLAGHVRRKLKAPTPPNPLSELTG